MLYLIFNWLHILFAIVAVGANVTYGLWIARATRTPEVLPFTLRTIKFLDDRFTNPSYGLLLVTGLVMVFVGDLPFEDLWLSLSIFLYLIAILLGLFGYTPTLRKQIALAESEGPESAQYKVVAVRGRTLGILLGVILMVIVYLMVTKPLLGA